MAFLAALAASRVAGQPAGTTQLVVPFEPGGNMGTIARLVADGLGPAWPEPVIVQFRSGADGNIGTAWVARSEPDGRTLLFTGSGMLVAPLLHADAGYDPLRDLEAVGRVAAAPNVLLANEALKGQALDQLVARSGDGVSALAFSSAGRGQTSHLAAELFMARTGARWLHVPYRGTGPAVRALLGGEVQLMFVPAGIVGQAIASGKAVAVAVAHPQRIAGLPGTPTLAELGVRGADYSQWYGVFAPAGTPAAVLNRWSDALVKLTRDPALHRKLEALGFEVAPMPRNEFTAFVAAEHQRVAALVKRLPKGS